MKKYLSIIASLILAMALLVIVLGSLPFRACAQSQGDILVLTRVSGTGAVLCYPPGTSGTWTAVTTSSNAILVTGTDGRVKVGSNPVISGTVANPVTGQIQLSGTQLQYWTGAAWHGF
jgi:hypothetical protein